MFHGAVPESEWDRMRAPFQDGKFPFPVKYGYAAVGLVEKGDDFAPGTPVFCLYPHQTRFAVPADALVALPNDLPPRRAVLAANMETALNAVWDGGIGPGDRVTVVGGGVLGLLAAGLAAGIPGCDVAVVDTNPGRHDITEALGARFEEPDRATAQRDCVIHASATPQGLQTALGLAGPEANVVELSWYGTKTVPIDLGGAFHSLRLTLKSSQVGAIPPARRPRWTHQRRLETALSLLRDPVFDRLITDEVAFNDLPDRLPDILGPNALGLATAVRYD